MEGQWSSYKATGQLQTAETAGPQVPQAGVWARQQQHHGIPYYEK